MKKFFKSLGYACNGFIYTLKAERNFRIHLVSMLLVILLGFYLGISLVSWGFIIFAIGFVLSAELFNTVIERSCNYVSDGKTDKSIEKIKDISAAAVLIAALTALVIGILFLFIPLLNKITAFLK